MSIGSSISISFLYLSLSFSLVTFIKTRRYILELERKEGVGMIHKLYYGQSKNANNYNGYMANNPVAGNISFEWLAFSFIIFWSC